MEHGRTATRRPVGRSYRQKSAQRGSPSIAHRTSTGEKTTLFVPPPVREPNFDEANARSDVADRSERSEVLEDGLRAAVRNDLAGPLEPVV